MSRGIHIFELSARADATQFVLYRGQPSVIHFQALLPCEELRCPHPRIKTNSLRVRVSENFRA